MIAVLTRKEFVNTKIQGGDIYHRFKVREGEREDDSQKLVPLHYSKILATGLASDDLILRERSDIITRTAAA